MRTVLRRVAIVAVGTLTVAFASLAPTHLPSASAATGPRGISVNAGVVAVPDGPIQSAYAYAAASGVPFLFAIDVANTSATESFRGVAVDTGYTDTLGLTGMWSCTAPNGGATPQVWSRANGRELIVLPETFAAGSASFGPGESFRCVAEVTLDGTQTGHHDFSPFVTAYAAAQGATPPEVADVEALWTAILSVLVADGGHEIFRAAAPVLAVTKWVEVGGERVTDPTLVEPGTYTVGWEFRNSGPALNRALRIVDVTLDGTPIDPSTLACSAGASYQDIAIGPDGELDADGNYDPHPGVQVYSSTVVTCTAQVTLDGTGMRHSDRVVVETTVSFSVFVAPNSLTFESDPVTFWTEGGDPAPPAPAEPAGPVLPPTGAEPAGAAGIAAAILLLGAALSALAARRGRIGA